MALQDGIETQSNLISKIVHPISCILKYRTANSEFIVEGSFPLSIVMSSYVVGWRINLGSHSLKWHYNFTFWFLMTSIYNIMTEY